MFTNLHPVQQAGPSADPGTPSPKLVNAAHEFEAQMMKELLKPLSSTGLTGEDGEEGDSGSGDALNAYATEAFGKALSDGGGFGVAKSIIATLSRPHTQVTAGTPGNTVLKPLS